MKTSNKILTSGLAALFTIILACLLYVKKEIKPEAIELNQEITKKESTLEVFNSLNIKGSYSINIHKGEPKIEMNGMKGLIDKTEAIVENNVLYIKLKNNERISFNSSDEVRIDIYTNHLISISSIGNGDIKCVDEYSEDNVELISSGNSDIYAKFIAKNLVVNSTGNGTISNTGHSDILNLDQTGNGDLQFFKSPADSAIVSLTGNGNIQIFCNKKLTANLIGNGDIIYRGNAEVIKNKIGNGEIDKEE